MFSALESGTLTSKRDVRPSPDVSSFVSTALPRLFETLIRVSFEVQRTGYMLPSGAVKVDRTPISSEMKHIDCSPETDCFESGLTSQLANATTPSAIAKMDLIVFFMAVKD